MLRMKSKHKFVPVLNHQSMKVYVAVAVHSHCWH